MAFDSVDYLRTWKETGRWPDIHAELTDLVAQTYQLDPKKDAVLDLCASVGIMGQQLQDRLKLRVVAVEWLQASIDRGREWGIDVPTMQVRVDRDTLGDFLTFLQVNDVRGIVARRCLSDVFGGTTEEGPLPEPDWEFAGQWCEGVISVGVTEVWLQGRAYSVNATHPLPHTNSEVACLATHFTVAERSKNCAYLTARPSPIVITAEQRQAVFDGYLEP